MRQTYRRSNRYKIDRLIEERRRWQRKLSLAANKLAKVNRRIEMLGIAWAVERDRK